MKEIDEHVLTFVKTRDDRKRAKIKPKRNTHVDWSQTETEMTKETHGRDDRHSHEMEEAHESNAWMKSGGVIDWKPVKTVGAKRNWTENERESRRATSWIFREKSRKNNSHVCCRLVGGNQTG